MKKSADKKPAAAKSILVLHGPNLNLLGTREPEIYGATTLAEINRTLAAQGKQASICIATFQSNHEGDLVDRIQAARAEKCGFIVINAGALTHTSLAIADALTAVAIPYIEVHISNVYARETFRHHSCLSAKAVGVICGLGINGYVAALDYAITHLNKKR